jgi:LmbE family N-acetylglucosaminyl deacetylase
MHSEHAQPRTSKLESSGKGDPNRPVVVFLFAHQDDEALVFSCIERALCEGSRVLCIYLTNGNFASSRSTRRDIESRRVLSRIGVNPSDIHFVGSMCGFPDGALFGYLNDALAATSAILSPLNAVRGLYVHAWEGGHQDHDAVHLLGVTYAARAGLLHVCRQFPGYRAAKNFLGLTILSPLAENGAMSAEPISFTARLRYLRLSLCYPSQWRTWIILFPLMAFSYWIKPNQEIQRVSTRRLLARPHTGELLYERRKRMTYDRFREEADIFLRKHLPHLFSDQMK